ncbi:uncharacterized protein L3040_002472 [Drepanopeziza brunnea f. sp. 'multigermtubi']|uniref:uncharacterized protein n=1 Tax=Drepanopeziza brunnea f. sp. 'multigermtubi' TaxID=698441 RepID=UPI0023861255|nr:hypothetical protein L3040_002472 [Drepanopeziza brunnea f. sp. 'multigermtubi']
MDQYRSVLDQEIKALLLRRNEEDSIRNEEAWRKRAAFKTEIDDQFKTEEDRADARLQQLITVEDDRLKLLKANQKKEMERLTERHTKGLADAEKERSRALKAYSTKGMDCLRNLIAAWDQEQAQLEADIEKEEADIQQARNIEDWENKEKWFNVIMSQTSLVLASEQDPGKTVFHPSDLNIMTPPREPMDGFAAANDNDILSRGEKRRFSDLQSLHRFSDSDTVGLAAMDISEESSLKKAKTAAPKPVLKLDPRYCFEVTHLFYKRRGAPAEEALELVSETDKKLFLSFGYTMVGPVFQRRGDAKHFESTASWFIERDYVREIHCYDPKHPQHQLVRFQMDNFSVWIKFMSLDVLNDFLDTLQSKWPGKHEDIVYFSDRYEGCPRSMKSP